jgi:hypothetical protein
VLLVQVLRAAHHQAPLQMAVAQVLKPWLLLALLLAAGFGLP